MVKINISRKIIKISKLLSPHSPSSSLS